MRQNSTLLCSAGIILIFAASPAIAQTSASMCSISPKASSEGIDSATPVSSGNNIGCEFKASNGFSPQGETLFTADCPTGAKIVSPGFAFGGTAEPPKIYVLSAVDYSGGVSGAQLSVGGPTQGANFSLKVLALCR